MFTNTMETKAQLDYLSRTAISLIAEHTNGLTSRRQLASWAASQLKQVSNSVFETSLEGHLIEYVLSRLIDDWIPDPEFRDEVQDLVGRLADAKGGNVRLP